MNRIILLIAFQLILSGLLSGQANRVSNQNTISIIVSDTMVVVPDEIRYTILIKNNDDASAFVDVNQFMPKLRLDSIIANHSEVTEISSKPFNFGYNEDAVTKVELKVIIIDETTLNIFLEDLHGYQNLTGYVSERVVYDDSDIEFDLKKRLINLAREKGRRTCKVINARLQNVYSIDEQEFKADFDPVNRTVAGWTAYPPQSIIKGHISKDKTEAIYYLKMEVRFNFRQKVF